MTHDILDQLRQFRPDDAALEDRWSADSRADLVARIQREQLPAPTRMRYLPTSRRGRLIASSALVAAAAAAAVLVPTLLPDGSPGSTSPAAAAALHRLARVAADTAADDAGPGQFVHTVTREREVGDFGSGKVEDLRSTYESWSASDGALWRRQTAAGDDGATTLYFPAKDEDAAYLASLPTDPDGLDSYLRSHVSGSNSTDEAVFVAIGDMLRDQTASAALRSADITVLANTDNVSLGPVKVDSAGRGVQEFDYVDEVRRPGVVESLFFDPYTAQLVDERTTGPGELRETTVVRSDVVDSVPEEVLRTAVTSN